MAHLIYLNSYEMNLSDLSHSQICQRVRSVICEAVWEAVRVRSVRPKWEADLWGRSVRPWESDHTPAESPILGAIWLISRLNALPHTVVSDRTSDSHGLTDRPHRSDSQICEAVGVRGGRPSDRSHDFVVRGRGSPSTASQIWESDLWGRSASHAQRAMQSDPRGRLTDFTAKRIASPGVRERPIGLTDRTLKSVRPCALEILCILYVWEAEFGRPWEAVWGRAPLIGSDRSHDKSERPWEAVRGRAPLIGSGRSLSQWEPHGLTRPLTASQIRPLKHIKYTESLTFDSNSTSDRQEVYQMC